MQTRSRSVSFIVQNIVMAECRALWKAGGAAGELDVYRFVELQFVSKCREAVPLAITGEMGNISEPRRAVGRIVTDGNDQPQLGQPRRAQIARCRDAALGREFAQHPDVVAGFEPGRGY